MRCAKHMYTAGYLNPYIINFMAASNIVLIRTSRKPLPKAKLLFIDCSSAFNAIQPHLLVYKLMNMKVNAKLFVWIQSFLCDRLQCLNFNRILLFVIEISTGAPLGFVSSTVLCIIYTTDCRSSLKHIIVQYADGTVIINRSFTTYTH